MNIDNYAQYEETGLSKQDALAYNTYACTIPLEFPRVALHWHDEFEIIYIKGGTARVVVDLVPYTAESGAIVIALPGQLHSIERSDTSRDLIYENIFFSSSILESADSDWCSEAFFGRLKDGSLHLPVCINPGTALHREASACLDAADALSGERSEGYALALKAQLFLFFHALYQHRLDGEEPAFALHESEKVKSALSYVSGHFSEKISIADAAAATGYSDSHFMRFFKKYTGQTFIEYLNDFRLEAAADLISATGEPINAIAEQCGFENFSYFCRAFKKKYGVSARRFRTGSQKAP